jgi:hypothetical protein
VVDEREQRVMAERLLPGLGGVLLLGVREDQHSVDVHDHLAARVRGRLAGQPPHAVADVGPRPADRREGTGPGRGEGVDQAGDGRVGGHRTEHGGLGPQHRGIGQAVAAQGYGECDVQQDFARVMDRPGLAPRRQCRRYCRVQPCLAGGLDQQYSAGLRDHLATTALDADTRVRPATLTHLESASDRGGNRDLDNPHSRWSEALSAFLTIRRTASLMKARG